MRGLSFKLANYKYSGPRNKSYQGSWLTGEDRMSGTSRVISRGMCSFIVNDESTGTTDYGRTVAWIYRPKRAENKSDRHHASKNLFSFRQYSGSSSW